MTQLESVSLSVTRAVLDRLPPDAVVAVLDGFVTPATLQDIVTEALFSLPERQRARVLDGLEDAP